MTAPSAGPLTDAAHALRQAIHDATRGLIERDVLAELVLLAAVASEHVLVVGPPGTGKSAVVRRVAQALGGQYFEYLLGRFTEPSELFGPVDLRKLRDGTVETVTTGMLPEAEVAFLDEIFLGSTAVLNTLLGILNERVFRRGHTQVPCPLRVCVGATNALPDETSLAAFADRFLVHVFLAPVPDAQLEALLAGGWESLQQAPTTGSNLGALDVLAQTVRQMDVAPLRPLLAQSIRLLRAAGIALSDRRLVKAQLLMAAAAALAGRTTPSAADVWPLIYVIPTEEGQQQGREVLYDLLQAAQNATLNAAVEEATASPQARATRLVAQAAALLAAPPELVTDGWRLQLEAIGREIDASFAPETLPEDLRTLRERLAALTTSPAA